MARGPAGFGLRSACPQVARAQGAPPTTATPLLTFNTLDPTVSWPTRAHGAPPTDVGCGHDLHEISIV
jgi:hypothetical protein